MNYIRITLWLYLGSTVHTTAKSTTKLSNVYLSAYINEYVDSHLDQLFNDGGLSLLVATLKRASLELYHIECMLLTVRHNNSQIIERGGSELTQEKRRNRNDKKNKHRSIQTDWGHSNNFNMNETCPHPSLDLQEQQKHWLTTKNEQWLQLVQISRDKLKQNTHYIEFVAAQALLFETGSDDGDSTTGLQQRKVDASLMSNTQKVTSMMNLLLTFLYMTNYYIVATTCGKYAESVDRCQRKLGRSCDRYDTQCCISSHGLVCMVEQSLVQVYINLFLCNLM